MSALRALNLDVAHEILSMNEGGDGSPRLSEELKTFDSVHAVWRHS